MIRALDSFRFGPAGFLGGAILALQMTLAAIPGQALALDRVDVSSVRPLFIAAIENGESHGILSGESALFMASMFKTREPMEVDVKAVRDLPEAGCKRLEVTTTQRGVYPDERALKLMSDEERRATRNGTVAQDIKFTYQISYCRGGRFPKQAGG
jgi:hypothetical protein